MNTDSQTQKQDNRLFFLINMARHHLFEYANHQCELQLDISVTQAGALLFIAKKQGCSQKQLATALGLKKSAVTGLVARMEKLQLIERTPSDSDARATQLWLSDTGSEKIPQIMPLIKQLNQQVTQDFSEEEINTVLRFLNQVIQQRQPKP